MSNPWLSIPLEDYEGHMGSPAVQQSVALTELFKRALNSCLPESLAVLGVAGGNGLEQIDPTVTQRIVGVDINQQYLSEVERRFGSGRITGLELHCCDLSERGLPLAPVALVHAALIFEHAGLDPALDNALSLVAPGGYFSVVLQLPSTEAEGVASTGYTSLQTLKRTFALIDVEEFERLLLWKGFALIARYQRLVPAGKVLWWGLASRAPIQSSL